MKPQLVVLARHVRRTDTYCQLPSGVKTSGVGLWFHSKPTFYPVCEFFVLIIYCVVVFVVFPLCLLFLFPFAFRFRFTVTVQSTTIIPFTQ